MAELNFLIVGDKKYFLPIKKCLFQINKIYKTASIYIYDWGFHEKEKDELISKNNKVKIFDWRNKIHDSLNNLHNNYDLSINDNNVNVAEFHNARLQKGFRKRVAKFFLKRFPKSSMVKKPIERAIRFEEMLVQKIVCLRDFSNFIGSKKFIFFDADAMLVKPFSEVLTSDYDIAFTMRRPERQSTLIPPKGKCLKDFISSGVVFFGSKTINRNIFLDVWLKEARLYEGRLREQAAASIIISDDDGKIPDYYSIVIKRIKKQQIKLFLLPADIYNYNVGLHDFSNEHMNKMSLLMLKEAKIVHFINDSYRHKNIRELVFKSID